MQTFVLSASTLAGVDLTVIERCCAHFFLRFLSCVTDLLLGKVKDV